MTVGPGVVIDAIPLAPPRVSLLTSVDVIPAGDERWANGMQWAPEACAPPDDPYWWVCPEGEGGAAPDYTKVIPPPESVLEYRPYDVWVGFRCGNQAVRSGEYQQLATRAIDAFQSSLIERELWAGAVAQAAGFPNDYLTNSPTSLNSDAATPFVRALGELEQALAECQPGQTGVVHAQPRLVTLWLSEGLVVPEPNGRRLRTALGTIVVPGAGYDGSGTSLPAGGTVAASYAYGTGMVRVWLGDQVVIGGEGGDYEMETSTNTVAVRVERAVAATWDECCQVAIQVDHTKDL